MRHLEEQELWALAAGESVPSDGDAAHLKSCRACEHRMGEMVRMRALASSARLTPPSTAARVQGLERFERAMQKESEQGRRWLDRRPLILPALGLSALAGAGVAIMMSGGAVQQPAPWAPPVETAQAERVNQVSPPVVAHVDVPAAPTSATPVVVEKHPAPAPARSAKKSAPAPARPVELAAAPVAAPAPVPVAVVEEEPSFPLVAQARELLLDGDPLRAADLAIGRLASENPSERIAAMDVVRDVALSHPTVDVLIRVDSAAQQNADQREALTFLGCEAANMGHRPSEVVQRCRAFVSAYPQSTRARVAAWSAGEMARRELGDCAGAIDDYSRAARTPAGLVILDDALLYRATCLAEVGRTEEARGDLAQYLSRNPSKRTDARVREVSSKLK